MRPFRWSKVDRATSLGSCDQGEGLLSSVEVGGRRRSRAQGGGSPEGQGAGAARGDSPGEYETGNQVDPETLLQEAETQNQRLGKEVRRLEIELGLAQECIKGLWDDQCKQLEESDCQLAATEAEIAWLRRQLTGGKPPNSLFSQAGSGVVPESLPHSLSSPPATGVGAVRPHFGAEEAQRIPEAQSET